MFHITIREILLQTLPATAMVRSARTLVLPLTLWVAVSYATGSELEPVAELKSLTIPCLAVSANGKYVAVGGSVEEGARLRLYEAASWELLRELAADGLSVKALAFSPDGKHLFGAVGNEVVAWQTSDGKLVARLVRHSALIFGVALSSDGKFLVSVGEDGLACVWDAVGLVRVKDLIQVNQRLYDVAFDPVTGALAIVGARGTLVFATSVDDVAPAIESNASQSGLLQLAHCPDSRRVAAIGMDRVVVARLVDGRVATKVHHPGRLTDGVAWLSDGRHVAIGIGRQVAILDVNEGQIIRRIGRFDSLVRCIEYDRSNNRLLAASWNGTIKVWSGDLLLQQEAVRCQ